MPASSGSRSADDGAIGALLADSPEEGGSRVTSAPIALGAPKALTDPRAVGATLSKLISASIGDITMVMSRAAETSGLTLADIQWRVLPPILAGQYYVAEASQPESGLRAPIAAVTWARVSAEVDRRLRGSLAQPLHLATDEWTGGEHYWLVDVIGDARGLEVALRWLSEGPLAGKQAHALLRKPPHDLRVVPFEALIGARP